MQTLEEYMKIHKKNREKSMDFASYLYRLMDARGIQRNADVYEKAGITKQAWSNIVSGKCQPSMATAIKLALALHLNTHECKYLLKKAGYTLSSASDFALIIRYCIENGIYDFVEVDTLLSENGYADFF